MTGTFEDINCLLMFYHDQGLPLYNLQETMQLALKPKSSNVFFEWWEAYQPKLQEVERRTPFVPNNVAIFCPDGFVFERHGKMVYSPSVKFHDNDFRSQILMPHNCEENLPKMSVWRVMSGRMDDPRAFWAAIFALVFGNHRFFEEPILPVEMPEREHFMDPHSFIENLQRNDIIASRNPEQAMSNIIARMDHGFWSHVAMYLGDGEVLEATPFQGSHKFGVEEFFERRGVHSAYRPLDTEGKLLETDWSSERIGSRYNYLGAFKLGLSLFFTRLQKSAGRKRTLACAGRLSPSGFVLDGSFFRVQTMLVE